MPIYSQGVAIWSQVGAKLTLIWAVLLDESGAPIQKGVIQRFGAELRNTGLRDINTRAEPNGGCLR